MVKVLKCSLKCSKDFSQLSTPSLQCYLNFLFLLRSEIVHTCPQMAAHSVAFDGKVALWVVHAVYSHISDQIQATNVQMYLRTRTDLHVHVFDTHKTNYNRLPETDN